MQQLYRCVCMLPNRTYQSTHGIYREKISELILQQVGCLPRIVSQSWYSCTLHAIVHLLIKGIKTSLILA
jgi:hypothetical protein